MERILLLLILLALCFSWSFQRKEKDVVIEFTGSECLWIVRFPGADNVFGKTNNNLVSEQNIRGIDSSDVYGDDDVVFANKKLVLPNNGNIVFKVTSLDFKHVFEIKELDIHINAIPGLTITHVFDYTIESSAHKKLHISCSEGCEKKCNEMKISLRFVPKTEFDNMINEIKKRGYSDEHLH